MGLGFFGFFWDWDFLGFFGIFWDFLGFFGFFKFPNWDWVFFGIGIFWDFLGFLNFQIGIGFFLGFFGIGIFWVFGFFGFSLYFLNLKLVLVFLFFDDYLWKYSQQSACQCLK